MDTEKSLITEALMAKKVAMILKAWYELPTKVSKESTEARQEGNKLFRKSNHSATLHKEIWKYYSQSVAKAPVASEDLALAYGNRSALLLHIAKFEDSIKDIDRALAITQSNCLKVKLLCRKIQCCSALGMYETDNILDLLKYWLSKVEREDKELLMKTVNKTIDLLKDNETSSSLRKDSSKLSIEKSISGRVNSEDIFRVESILKYKESTDPFEIVSLKQNKKYGRHLIAGRDIKPGEIIIVSRPYVTALNLNNSYAFCGHCLKTSWASIPCDYCSWCMYCSEKCKNEAWEKYHDIECQVIPYIQFNQTSDYWKQHSLKLAIMAVKEAGDIEKLKEELKIIDEYHEDESHEGLANEKLQKNCFQSIYSLCGNVSSDALQIHVDHAVLTLVILAKSTSFFGEDMSFCSRKDLLLNEDVLFIGSLILKFLKISDINAHCVMEGSSACRFGNSIEKCQMNRCCERGVCLATVPSFLNHSCYPNVRKCFTEDMQLVIYALQPIRKRDQLFDSYIGTYFDKSYSERKTLLQEFNFECSCLPCKKQWPTIILLHNHLNYTTDSSTPDIEATLLAKHQALIQCKDGKLFNLTALNELSADIEKAKSKLPEPSYAVATLISTFWTAFDYIYGIRLEVAEKCNNV